MSSLQDAVRQGYVLCISSRSGAETLRNRYAGILLRFVHRRDELSSVDDGLCDGTIMALEDLATAHSESSHCDKLPVGQPVLKEAQGMPLYHESSVYPSFKYYLQQETNNGDFENYVEQHRPTSQCSATQDASGSLSVEDCIGTFLIVLAFTIAGVVTSIATKDASRDASKMEGKEGRAKIDIDSFSSAA